MKQRLQKTFNQGINAAVSSSVVDNQSVVSSQGVVQRKIGRYSPCWEGQSVDTVNSVDSDFEGLSSITDNTLKSALGNKLVAWWAADNGDNSTSGSEYDTLADKTGNGHTLTHVGTNKWDQITVGSHTMAHMVQSEDSRYRSPVAGSRQLDGLTNGVSVFGVFDRRNTNGTEPGLIRIQYGRSGDAVTVHQDNSGSDVTLAMTNPTVQTLATNDDSLTETTNTKAGVYMSPDGVYLFILTTDGAGSADTVYRFTLGTPYQFSGETSDQSYSVNSEDTTPYGITFSSDGTKMFVGGATNNKIFQYSLGTAWTISSGVTKDSSEMSITWTSNDDLGMSESGTHLITIAGARVATIHKLATPNDIGTVDSTTTKSLNGDDTAMAGIDFARGGADVYAIGNTGSAVYHYELTTAYDMSTATLANSLAVTNATRGCSVAESDDNVIYYTYCDQALAGVRKGPVTTSTLTQSTTDIDASLPSGNNANRIFGFTLNADSVGGTAFSADAYSQNQRDTNDASLSYADSAVGQDNSGFILGVTYPYATATADEEMDIYIGDVLVCTGNLTDAEVSTIMEYLNQKYSATTNGTYADPFIQAPWRMHYFDAPQRLLASSRSGIACVAGINAAITRGKSEVTEFHDYGDYVVVSCDKTPLYAVHKDNITHATETAGSGATGTPWDSLDSSFKLAGKGLFFSHEYHDTSTLDFTAASTAASDSSSGAKLEIGSGSNDAWHKGGNVTYTNGAGQIQISRSNTGNMEAHALPTRGYFWAANTDNAITLMDAADNTQENADYRIGVPGQWAMGRFLSTYDRRFSFIEAREFRTGYLYDGSGESVNSTDTSNNYVVINTDLQSNEISVGDRLITAPDTCPDPIMFTPAEMQTLNIIGIEYPSGTSTRIYVDAAPNALAGYNWWIQRRLTAAERRYIWDCGRPADADRNIDTREDLDLFFVHSSNFTTWGNDDWGDCVARVTLDTNREILSQEKALWTRSGTPPIDGVTPPGYGVRLLRSGIGIRNDACWAFDDTRSRLFFNSPVDNRMYVMRGEQTDKIDRDIVDHPLYTGIFSHVVHENDRLSCLDTSQSEPVTWIYDTVKNKWDSPTIRKGLGVNQLGSGTPVSAGLDVVGSWAASTVYAVDTVIEDSNGNYQVVTTAGTSGGSEPTWETTGASTTTDNTVTWTCYKATAYYDTDTNGHGGLFAPFLTQDENERALVVYRDASNNFAARTLNYEPDHHSDVRLLHGGSITPSAISQLGDPVAGRMVEFTTYQRTVDDVPADVDRLRVSMLSSEGIDSEVQYIEPEWNDDRNETRSYKGYLNPTRGSASLEMQLGDNIAPVPEIEAIDIEFRLRGNG